MNSINRFAERDAHTGPALGTPPEEGRWKRNFDAAWQLEEARKYLREVERLVMRGAVLRTDDWQHFMRIVRYINGKQ